MTANQFHPGEISDLRSRAEEKLGAAEAKPEERPPTAELKRLVHELQVHQIELEMQNEELRRTQIELEASRTRYFDLYDLAPVGYFTLSENGAILEANVTGANLLGVSRRELLQRPLTRHVFPDDRDIFYKHHKQIFAMHVPQACELRMLRKDAAPFWARVETTAPRESENGMSVTRVVMCDITEQKDEQNALSRATFCIEQAGDGILWIDSEGKVVFANQKACEFLEYSREELGAMTLFDFNPMFTPEKWMSHWEAVRQRKAFVIETCHRSKTGRFFPVEVCVNYMTFAGKEYSCSFVREISERKKAEERLAHFSAIVDSSQDAIIGKTLDGIVTSWNPGADHLYGYTAAEMIGQPISTLLPPDRSDELRTLLAKVGNGGRVEQYDTVRRRKDGTLVDVSLTLSPIKNNDGKIIGASAIAHDITNRKRAVEAIRQSEEKLANIVRNAAEGIYTLSVDGLLTFVSPAWTEKLGYDASEIEGQSFVPLIHPDDTEICHGAIKRILATGTPQEGTYRIRHKDGSWRWHHSVGSLVKDRDGHPAGLVGVAEDVTERLRVEEMLRASEEKYRAYINNSPTGVFVADSTGRFVEVNAAGCRLLGYSEAELTRMRISDIVVTEDLQSAMAMHHELTHVSSAVRGEFCFIRKDGSRCFMSVDAVRVQEDRLVGFCIDITQRVNAERSLQQQSDTLRQSNQRLEEACGKAEAASQSKSEFLANMSHELRTPMTAILGFSDILAENCVKAESIEAAQIIKRNGEHLLNVINDILDLSKIEAGRGTVDRQKCSPSQIAAEVLTLMKVRADAKGLPLTLEVYDDVPKTVTTDPIRLRQILVNLIGNAIKFTEIGGVRVVMRSVPASENEDRLIFDVIDTGIGMSEEQIRLLFRPFSQVDGSASRRFGGTGLGLAISKRMAEMLGGDIVVQSIPGQGSTFSLSIAIGQRDGLMATPEPNKELAVKKPLPQNLACRILLAEDGPDNQRLIAFLLRKSGAKVEIAGNGQIALDLALAAKQAGKPFDIILMDMQMPVMDGYEATQKLRATGYREPIIALTAHAMTEDRRKCIDAGCDDYISKPIDPKKLVGLLEPWVAMESSPA